jgi:hypothetical protein
MADTRYAEVAGSSGITEAKVAAYLPSNYRTTGMRPGEFGMVVLVEGTDRAGWTLDDYVIPRIGSSGTMAAREVTPPDDTGEATSEQFLAVGLGECTPEQVADGVVGAFTFEQAAEIAQRILDSIPDGS